MPKSRLNEKHKKKLIVISLSGSFIVPGQSKTQLVKQFVSLVEKLLGDGYRFLIVVGGGSTARTYQEGLEKIMPDSDVREGKDWIGIYSTHLNAEFLRLAFGSLSPNSQVLKSPYQEVPSGAPITFVGGWKPGWSTDYVTVSLAERNGIDSIINISNTDYIYTEDPKTNEKAVPIPELNWKQFRSIIPKTWVPGMHSPFDPIAAKKAEKADIKVASINGSKLEEIEKYLAGEKFIGSLIH